MNTVTLNHLENLSRREIFAPIRVFHRLSTTSPSVSTISTGCGKLQTKNEIFFVDFSTPLPRPSGFVRTLTT
jgi:hypothetical protein